MFGGIHKTTLIDYPGKAACVLFVSGCNFRCPYCHNPELVMQTAFPGLSVAAAFSLLESRRGFLDGVVISGGEPTLHPSLAAVCKGVKDLGYALKLDTNGSRPGVIERLISGGLVDYLAMDIKTDSRRYGRLTREVEAAANAAACAALITASGIPHEFRTTCITPLVDDEAISEITAILRGASLYVLQRFVNRKVLDPPYFAAVDRRVRETDLVRWQSLVEKRGIRCIIR